MTEVEFTTDPVEAWQATRSFLRRDPVGNNVLCTLLGQRSATALPVRCWWVPGAGVVFQSPDTFPAVLSTMSSGAAAPLAEKVASAGLPGGGRTGERRRRVRGRLRVSIPEGCGTGRRAADLRGDRGPAASWCRWEPPHGHRGGRRAPDGGVYTPPGRRNHGYAAAAVAALSSRILAGGERPILYTQLQNPTSNGVYQRIGYEAVAEVVRYSFGQAQETSLPERSTSSRRP